MNVEEYFKPRAKNNTELQKQINNGELLNNEDDAHTTRYLNKKDENQEGNKESGIKKKSIQSENKEEGNFRALMENHDNIAESSKALNDLAAPEKQNKGNQMKVNINKNKVVRFADNDILKLRDNNNNITEETINADQTHVFEPPAKEQTINNYMAGDNNSMKIDDLKSVNLEHTIIENKYDTPITLKDYELLSPQETVIHDRRSLVKILKDLVFTNHRVASIFMKSSIIDPVFIKVLKFSFHGSLAFGLNAMVFSDVFIEKRATSSNKVFIIYN
jgi:hypothetical protein